MEMNDLECLEWPFCDKFFYQARQVMNWSSRLSDKTVAKFRATYILSATKMYGSGPCFYQAKVYVDIPGGSLERGRQMKVWS